MYMCYKGGRVGHNQVHDIDGNTAETDMEADQEDNQSDFDGNEVPLLNNSDDDSDTDSGECDSDVEEAEDDEDLHVEEDKDGEDLCMEEDEDKLEYY